MNHSTELLADALKATVELQPEIDAEFFRFRDSRLQYELHLHLSTKTAFLAIDPTEPMQGCPMLEFSFRCTDIQIGTSAYCTDGTDIAIRFYENETSQKELRLTMTWVPIGHWYVWANANSKPYAEVGD